MKKTLLASAVMLAVSAPALAEQRTGQVRDNGFSYQYLQLGYEQWDLDGGFDLDTIAAEGAFTLDEHWHLRGGVSLYDGDYRNVDADGRRLSFGAGFHSPLQRGLDLVVSGDLIWDEVDVSPGGDDDDLGFELRGGVRHATADKLELSGGLSYYDVYDDDLALYGEATFAATSAFDVGARLVVGGDRDVIGLFGRYNF